MTKQILDQVKNYELFLTAINDREEFLKFNAALAEITSNAVATYNENIIFKDETTL